MFNRNLDSDETDGNTDDEDNDSDENSDSDDSGEGSESEEASELDSDEVKKPTVSKNAYVIIKFNMRLYPFVDI